MTSPGSPPRASTPDATLDSKRKPSAFSISCILGDEKPVTSPDAKTEGAVVTSPTQNRTKEGSHDVSGASDVSPPLPSNHDDATRSLQLPEPRSDDVSKYNNLIAHLAATPPGVSDVRHLYRWPLLWNPWLASALQGPTLLGSIPRPPQLYPPQTPVLGKIYKISCKMHSCTSYSLQIQIFIVCV